MSDLGSKIKGWCQEQSLALAAEQDDDAGLVYVVTMPGEPALSLMIRGSGAEPDPVTVTHTFEMPVPQEVQSDPEGREQVATLLERTAASRSGLIDCRLVNGDGRTAAEVSVTLHGDGLTKQSFLSALTEISKVRRVVTWGLDNMTLAMDTLTDMSAMVQETEALASEISKVAEGMEEAVAAEEAAPPSEAVSAEAPPPPSPPEPAPAPAAEAAPPPAPERRFCSSCGRETKPGQRFCIGCGTSLETQG
jgi:hypothetical protein